MDHDRDLAEYERMLQEVGGSGIAPPFVDAVEGRGEWYTVHRYLAGRQPAITGPGAERVWSQVRSRLEDLLQVTEIPRFDLLGDWTDRLGRVTFPDTAAERLRLELMETVPAGESTLAHGDFAWQNLILTGDGLVLVDWEHAGRAPAGFDAGWLLALAEAGAIPGADTAAIKDALVRLRIPAQELRWFACLGFLRLLWRTSTLPLAEPIRVLLRAQVLSAIRREPLRSGPQAI